MTEDIVSFILVAPLLVVVLFALLYLVGIGTGKKK
jgi:hypothetical protein